jgi:septum formation protein
LILGSSSPRRRQLLEEAGYEFRVVPPRPQAECGLCSGEGPAETVARLALAKAIDVAEQVGRGLIVACDTVAEYGGQILGKPADRDHARQMLRMLSGRRHRVYSGLCVWNVPSGTPAVEVDQTELTMDLMPDDQLEAYVGSGAWEGKAGGFGYQDRLGWVHILEGSESNVVGLPIERLTRMLAEAGY